MIFGVELIVVTVHIVGTLLFVRESPSYLALKERYECAFASVRYYHGCDANVEEVKYFRGALSTTQCTL